MKQVFNGRKGAKCWNNRRWWGRTWYSWEWMKVIIVNEKDECPCVGWWCPFNGGHFGGKKDAKNMLPFVLVVCRQAFKQNWGLNTNFRLKDQLGETTQNCSNEFLSFFFNRAFSLAQLNSYSKWQDQEHRYTSFRHLRQNWTRHATCAEF